MDFMEVFSQLVSPQLQTLEGLFLNNNFITGAMGYGSTVLGIQMAAMVANMNLKALDLSHNQIFIDGGLTGSLGLVHPHLASLKMCALHNNSFYGTIYPFVIALIGHDYFHDLQETEETIGDNYPYQLPYIGLSLFNNNFCPNPDDFPFGHDHYGDGEGLENYNVCSSKEWDGQPVDTYPCGGDYKEIDVMGGGYVATEYPEATQSCGTTVGDVNADGSFNILDIVSCATIVLGECCSSATANQELCGNVGGMGEIFSGHPACAAADMNESGDWNVLDIVNLANCVLNENCDG